MPSSRRRLNEKNAPLKNIHTNNYISRIDTIAKRKEKYTNKESRLMTNLLFRSIFENEKKNDKIIRTLCVPEKKKRASVSKIFSKAQRNMLRPHSLLSVTALPLVLLSLLLAVAPRSADAGFLWYPERSNISDALYANCTASACIFNASNATQSPLDFPYQRCVANVRNETNPDYRDPAFECRCLADLYRCLLNQSKGNCEKKLARQACFAFWGSTFETVRCSYKLCTSAGSVSTMAAFVMSIVVVTFIVFCHLM